MNFSKANVIEDAKPFDLQGKTPLERVLQEKDFE
jgi:hypothetical protein